MRKVRSTARNQRLIIINLAISELLFCLNQMVYYGARKLMEKPSVLLVKINLPIKMFALTANEFIMLCLIFDRFADIYLHLKYAIYFTKRRTVYILSTIWVLSAIYGTALGVFGHILSPGVYPTIHNDANNYVSIVLDIVITISGIATFVYFYAIVYQIRKRDNARFGTKTGPRRRHPSLKFIVPFFMVVTYIMFNAMSTMISWFAFVCRKRGSLYYSKYFLLMHISWVLVVVGYLSDALLYIFFQKKVRSYLLMHMTFKKDSNGQA